MIRIVLACLLALCAAKVTAQEVTAAKGAAGFAIEQPRKGETGGREVRMSGTVSNPGQRHIWIVARRADFSPMWWPQQPAELDAVSGRWRGTAFLGGPQDVGHDFDVGAVVMDSAGHAYLSGYRDKARKTNDYRPIALPPGAGPSVVVTVRKTTH